MKLSRQAKAMIDAVEAAGGSVVTSRDGHVKIFDGSGRFVMKLRGHGKGTGENSSTHQSVVASVVRKVKGGAG